MLTRPVNYFHALVCRARRSPMLAAMVLYSVYFGVVISMTILAVWRSPPTVIMALN